MFGRPGGVGRGSAFGGSALAGPEAGGRGGLVNPQRLAGRPRLQTLGCSCGGHSALGTLRHKRRLAQPGSHPINVLPDRAFRRLRAARARRLGRAGRTPNRPRCGIPTRVRGRRGLRWRAGRRSGRGAGSGSFPGVHCSAEAGAWAPGSYRIHRDGLVLWRPEHRPSLAPSVGAGAGEPLESRCRGRRGSRGESPSQCGVARKREPVSSPRRPRMRRHRSSDSRCLRLH